MMVQLRKEKCAQQIHDSAAVLAMAASTMIDAG